jgi:hypothetical protein
VKLSIPVIYYHVDNKGVNVGTSNVPTPVHSKCKKF